MISELLNRRTLFSEWLAGSFVNVCFKSASESSGYGFLRSVPTFS